MSEKGEAAESALHDFGRDLGIAFQIIDDALDYSAAQEELGKTIGDDFREGKVTLPVILAYQKASMEEKDFWRGALAERKQKPGDLIQAIAFIRKAGALKDAAACARGYAEKARAKLRSFPDSLEKQALEKVLSFAVNRPY